MKIRQVKWILFFLMGLSLALQIQAQDSSSIERKSLIQVKESVDTLKSNLQFDSVEKSILKVDSVNSSPSKSTSKEAEAGKTKKDRVADTVVVEAAQRKGENVLGDNKIEDLSKLLSSSNIFYTIVFLLFGFVFIKVITFILNALAERSTTYRIAFKGSIPIVKIVGWVIVTLLIIVVIFKPSVASMLAVSASIGVAIGFASQDILKNIFGGIVILLDRPFVSGDKIEVDKYYGEVVEIGLRSTRIVTPDDSLVSVPNAVMMNSSLANSNAGEPNCQVVAEIYLPLTIDSIKTREIATQAATVSKYIYLGKPITILFLNEVNNNHSYYKMRVKAYVMDIRDEFRFKSDMTELIITELVKEGILDGKF
jgi:small-conductance mechanosensitive channel